MPKETFLNLKADKRRLFIDVALREFGVHDYKRASLSRIVETLGIAKGSVYQYFADKRDLYLYLLDVAANEKLSYLQEAQPADGGDVFSTLAGFIRAGTNFDFRYPEFSLIMNNAMKEKPSGELGDIARTLVGRSIDFLVALFQRGVDDGEIRGDIDIALSAHMLHAMIAGFAAYLQDRYQFDIGDQLLNDAVPFSDDELENDIKAFINIARQGLALPS